MAFAVRDNRRGELGPFDTYDGLPDSAEAHRHLTMAQLPEAFPDAEHDADLPDNVLGQLADLGVEVCEDKADDEEGDGDGEESQTVVPDTNDIAVDDAIGLYFAQAGKVPLLVHEEEIALAKQMEQGRRAQQRLELGEHTLDEETRLRQLANQGGEARTHLIEANTRLVVSIATKYKGRGLPFGDLIQAGNLGLIEGIDRYDYRVGTRVSTYATWWIRQSIMRTLARQARLIRIPDSRGALISRIYREADRLAQDGGYLPTPEQIAEELELDPESVRSLMCVTRHPVSLHEPIGDAGDTELGDLIEDEGAPAPPQTVERQELRKELDKALSDLPPREARVLNMRFGLDVGRGHSLTEVGKALGVSRERARQIELRALKRLRHPRRARALRQHLD